MKKCVSYEEDKYATFPNVLGSVVEFLNKLPFLIKIHQCCIYLMKNTVKTVILWNIIIMFCTNFISIL